MMKSYIKAKIWFQVIIMDTYRASDQLDYVTNMHSIQYYKYTFIPHRKIQISAI